MKQKKACLKKSFFCRPADEVAIDLLGTSLVICTRQGRETRHVIFETEAYLGVHDLACHGSKGMTKRNAVMFGPAGYWYVYLCYGMHWMLNVVTGSEGVPAAVLIRGAGEQEGPGRLTKALRINNLLNGKAVERKSRLWIESNGVIIPRRNVQRTPRIGVAYAREWAEKPLRFVMSPENIPILQCGDNTRRKK
ncbi:MAG: DNA-3-methyladenine glycosylase [Pirellulales bacterium]